VALSQVKTRKAGGIVPELILLGGSVLQYRLLALMKAVWNEGRVVDICRDHMDALFVPWGTKERQFTIL